MADSKVIKEFVRKQKEEVVKEDLGFEEANVDSILSEGFKALTSEKDLYYKAVTSKGLAFEISRGEVYSSLVDSPVMMSLINNIRRNSISILGRGRDDVIKMATSNEYVTEDFEDDPRTKTMAAAIARGFGKA